MIRKRNTPTIYLKADQFQCSDINVLFHYDRNYDASIVKEFFSKDQDKLIVIDSAEDIFRLENKKCLLLFIDSFARDGWKFLFAVRSAEAKNLNSYIESLVKTKVYSVQVKTLSDDDLRRFLNQSKLPIPSNRHLRERLTNLFYLSQYVSIKGQANSTLSDFKEVVWEKKVKGGDNETRARQESREQNLFLLVEEYYKTGRSIISPQGLSLDYSSIDGLEKDEVIVSIPHLGYSFAHDIFIDWAEEFIINRKWYKSNHDVDAFLIQLDNNIVTRNAFSRWFDDKVESNDNCIKEFIQKAMDNRIETAWMKSVVASVLNYKDSSESFVRRYEETFLDNGGQLFFTVLSILCVQCVVIDRFVSYEGKQFPIMKPTFNSEYNYRVDKESKTINITPNENYIKDFWGKGVSELTAIIGNNGAGKSTSIRFLLGCLVSGVEADIDGLEGLLSNMETQMSLRLSKTILRFIKQN